MARISELVTLKFELLFGSESVRRQQEFLVEHVYHVLGFDVKTGITFSQVIQLRDHLINHIPDARIIGFEEYDGSDIIATEVWESYGDAYSPGWIEKALTKLNSDTQTWVYVRLPEGI